MKLPFKESALAPYVSEETVQFHYGKHHKAYVDKVNELISGTEFQDTPLEEIIESQGLGDELVTLVGVEL